MARTEIGQLKFAKIYPLYVQKAERKGRTRDEVDRVISWLTGYDAKGLAAQAAGDTDFEQFFADAPAMNQKAALIKGVVCGIRVEDIADPLTQKVRYLDKLIDELARGKKMDSILRS